MKNQLIKEKRMQSVQRLHCESIERCLQGMSIPATTKVLGDTSKIGRMARVHQMKQNRKKKPLESDGKVVSLQLDKFEKRLPSIKCSDRFPSKMMKDISVNIQSVTNYTSENLSENQFRQ